jgi:hypothetical protein
MLPRWAKQRKGGDGVYTRTTKHPVPKGRGSTGLRSLVNERASSGRNCHGIVPCPAKTPSRIISLDFQALGPHAFITKVLLMGVVVQSPNPITLIWFNQVAATRILALRHQLNIMYKRKSKKPVLRNKVRPFWLLLSSALLALYSTVNMFAHLPA